MGQPVDLLGVLLGQEQDQTLWLVPAPPSACKGDNLCCKSKKPTVLQWSVPELCCIDFRQSVKVAQGLRIVRAKLLQVWSRGWLEGDVLCKAEGAQPLRVGISWYTVPNSGPKLLKAAGLPQEAGLVISVICGIQTNVLGSGLLSESCIFRHLRLYSLSFPLPQVFP